MNIEAKLAILADAAKYDASCASSGAKSTRAGSKIGSTEGMGICHSYTPDGRCVSLLKILLTNYCVYDCKYCINRISSDTPRARFTVDEVVRLTLDFYQRNYIEGLFLSSGVIQSPDYTLEQLVLVAKTLREVHHFGGYIHLKGIPGAAPELLTAAGQYADRISVNIELPTKSDLVQLAPEKRMEQIDGAMTTLREKMDETHADRKAGLTPPRFAPAGQSTQMIIGATPTPDLEVLRTSSRLYKQRRLRRVYYSAFSPIPDPDQRLSPTQPPLVREHRLYQADWLLRFYGFGVEELVTEPDQNLSLVLDPKLAWALAHREEFPVDVNRAGRRALLRVPGIGVRTVNRILQLRCVRSLRLADLKKLRVAWKRTEPFVLAADSNHGVRQLDSERLIQRFLAPTRQRTLFDLGVSAIEGEF